MRKKSQMTSTSVKYSGAKKRRPQKKTVLNARKGNGYHLSLTIGKRDPKDGKGGGKHLMGMSRECFEAP